MSDEDAVLVGAVQAGDKEAFAELFRRHYPAVRRSCARRLRDMAEADEIAQAAFVRALERIDRCGGERRFGAWVQVIAQRLCIDAVRARARTTPQEEPLRGERELAPNAPEEALLDSDRAAAIRVALATLPPRQRDVVIARDLHDRRPPEIAAALGLSIGAVDSLLLRARRRLAGAYRAAAGEQGISSTASSAAVAGTSLAATNQGFVAAVAAGVRAVRDAVVAVPAAVAGLAPAVPTGARRAAAAAVTALVLGTAGAPVTPAHVPAASDQPTVSVTVPVPPTTVPDEPLGEPLPAVPEPGPFPTEPPPSPVAPSAPLPVVPAAEAPMAPPIAPPITPPSTLPTPPPTAVDDVAGPVVQTVTDVLRFLPPVG